MEIKERIKDLRKELRLTQKEFAERIGMKPNTIATYELGRAIPSAPAINNICKEFNVNEAWLRTGEGAMFAKHPSSTLDLLAAERGLSNNERALIETILEMDQHSRKAVLRFMTDFADRVNEGRAARARRKEAEADGFAEFARRSYLEEKEEDAGASSATKSSAG